MIDGRTDGHFFLLQLIIGQKVTIRRHQDSIQRYVGQPVVCSDPFIPSAEEGDAVASGALACAPCVYDGRTNPSYPLVTD